MPGKICLVAVIALALVVLVPVAFPASPPVPFAARVAALEQKVKALQKREEQLRVALAASSDLSACGIAITADAFQGTWQTVDQLSMATQSGKTYFGPQSPVDDTVAGQDVCQTIGLTRSQAVPPNADRFEALLDGMP